MASISSVFVDFVARTAGFQSDVAKAADSVKEAGTKMKQTHEAVAVSNDKLTRSFAKGILQVAVGAEAYGLIRREIAHVIANIDKIPGIPAETVSSVNVMKQSFTDARNVLDGWIAAGLSGFAKFGQAIGANIARIANMVQGIDESDFSALAKLETPDEAARLRDPNFDDKLTAAKTRLVEATRRSSEANMDEVARIKDLQATAQRYETYAKSSSITTVQRLEAEIKASELTAQANAKLSEWRKKAGDELRKLNEVSARHQLAQLSPEAQLSQLTLQKRALEEQVRATRAQLDVNPNDPDNLKRRAELTQRLTEKTSEYNSTLDQVVERSHELRTTVVNAFSSVGDEIAQMIVTGKANFASFFQSVAQQVIAMALKLAIINPLINGMFGLTGTRFALATITGFATGGRPNPGEVSVVGEDGPELFVPDGTGTVISNSQLRSGGGGGNTYNIDARGADAGVEQRVMNALVQLAGPGVTERRSVVANIGARNRRLAGA